MSLCYFMPSFPRFSFVDKFVRSLFWVLSVPPLLSLCHVCLLSLPALCFCAFSLICSYPALHVLVFTGVQQLGFVSHLISYFSFKDNKLIFQAIYMTIQHLNVYYNHVFRIMSFSSSITPLSPPLFPPHPLPPNLKPHLLN